MVKAVVFDLGKVLVDFDYGIAARRIAARSRMSAEELMLFLVRSPLFVDFEKGHINRHRLFDEICAVTGYQGDLREFGKAFSDIFVEIEPMVRLHAALRDRKIPSYIFSNTNDLAVEHIQRNFPFYGTFDGYVLSYEHGLMKPEAGLYEVVEGQSGRRGAELLYLDDRPENVEAGAARGWRVVLHETPEKSLAAVQTFGLLD
jgi:FMN phosphatase YigB (HAD superfamily)